MSNTNEQIIDFNTTGNFDFAILENSSYNIHGLSYKKANTPNSVNDLLAAITQDADINDLTQINNAANAQCLDLSSDAITITIHPIPTGSFTNATHLSSCQENESGSIRLEITPASTSPWTVKYTFNQTDEQTITVDNSPFEIPVSEVGIYPVSYTHLTLPTIYSV